MGVAGRVRSRGAACSPCSFGSCEEACSEPRVGWGPPDRDPGGDRASGLGIDGVRGWGGGGWWAEQNALKQRSGDTWGNDRKGATIY